MAEVRMDYDAVGNVSQGFGVAATTLKAVSVALEVAIRAAQAATIISLGSSQALARYLSNIKPRVDRLAATCEEMSNDLRVAIAEHMQADQSARGQFG